MRLEMYSILIVAHKFYAEIRFVRRFEYNI